MKRIAVMAAIVTMQLAASASAQTTGPQPPDAFLASSSGEVKGEMRAFCWSEPDAGGGPTERLCADRFGPIDPAVALTVEAGELLTLRFDRPISPISIRVLRRDNPSSEPTPLFDVPPGNPTEFRAELPPGTHFLTVFTRWGLQDDAIYEFEITVEPATMTTCRPGHGKGDTKHCHTGPPGHSRNGTAGRGSFLRP